MTRDSATSATKWKLKELIVDMDHLSNFGVFKVMISRRNGLFIKRLLRVFGCVGRQRSPFRADAKTHTNTPNNLFMNNPFLLDIITLNTQKLLK